MVRERTSGGEWGVSFVRKPFKDTTTASSTRRLRIRDNAERDVRSASLTGRRHGAPRRVRAGDRGAWAPSFITIENASRPDEYRRGMPVQQADATKRRLWTSYAQHLHGQTPTNRRVQRQTSFRSNDGYGKVPLFKIEARRRIIVPGLMLEDHGGRNNYRAPHENQAVYLFGANKSSFPVPRSPFPVPRSAFWFQVPCGTGNGERGTMSRLNENRATRPPARRPRAHRRDRP